MMESLDKRATPILAVICTLGAALAWANRFIQDDAFISLRYARNLVEGDGLTWNQPGFGDRVEGYTNFLWTLILAVPLRLGVDPFLFVSLAGVLMMPVTLILTYKLAVALFNSRPVGLAAALLLATNYTFSSYASGGLETHLQALLCTATLLLAVRCVAHQGGPTARRLLALSAVTGLALLTRLDSLLIAGPACAIAGYAVVRDARSPARLLLLAVPGAAIVGAWLAWKVGYYGELLPNTFYAKAAGKSLPLRGVLYIVSFLCSYALAPFLVAVPFMAHRLWRLLGIPRWLLVGAACTLWLAYLVNVGGDFMEFRFLVPLMPLLMSLAAWVIVAVVERPAWSAALVALLVIASAVHAKLFNYSPLKRGVESIAELERNLYGPDYDWVGIGKYLRDAFAGHPTKPIIAVTPAGAIPYYSDLPAIDMLGLNDREIARHGASLADRPGHRKISTIRYLVERRVTFVIGHPIVVAKNARTPELDFATYRDGVTVAELREMFVGEPVPDPGSFPIGTKALLVPMAGGRHLLAIYLAPSAEWDAAIARLGWIVVDFSTLHREG